MSFSIVILIMFIAPQVLMFCVMGGTEHPAGATSKTNSEREWLSLIGITGPVLFWIIVFGLGFLTPGYSTISDVISDLAAVNAPYAVVQQANFVVLGVSILAVAIGLDRYFRDGWRPWVGIVLLAIFGLGVIGSGIFQTNPANRASTTQLLHSVFSVVAFLSGLLGTPLASLRLAQNDQWSAYTSRVVVLGITGVVFGGFALLMLSNGTSWSGLAQRLFVGVLTAWVFYHAYQLQRLTKT